MKNQRGTGDRIDVVAAATRTSGVPVVEANFAGIPETNAASGALYSLVVVGEHEIDFIASSAVGDIVLINDTTNVLTRVAYDAAISVGTRPFAKVTRVPNPAAYPEPKAGKMWVKLLDQAGALGAAATA
jgi:hypothetical protein